MNCDADPTIGNERSPMTPILELAPDHPSKKPADSLVYITYQVFLQAGKGGLTAREAASRIEDSGLGGPCQGLVKPRIKVGKIVRNNPYYFQAGEGKYILCEAIVGVTHGVATVQPPAQQLQSVHTKRVQNMSPLTSVNTKKEAATLARRNGTAKYWAQLHANGWTRGSRGRHKRLVGRVRISSAHRTNSENALLSSDMDEGFNMEERYGKVEMIQGIIQAHPKPQLKGMYDSTVSGKPCKRSDGKNWQCSLPAPSKSNYCEHHQQRMKQAAESPGVLKGPSPVTEELVKESTVGIKPLFGRGEGMGKMENEGMLEMNQSGPCQQLLILEGFVDEL